MSLLGEIKRRKVFQVAAVYAVVAWLIIQIVDVVGEPLILPDWIDAVVIVLLAVGFPIAVILAWAFDLTPRGIESDSSPQDTDAPTHLPGQTLNFTIQGLVLVAVGFLVLDQYLFESNAISTPASAVSTSTELTSFDYDLPEDQSFRRDNRLVMALSRDGRHFVYNTTDGLYLRSMGELEARLISGTEPALASPIFSPDGQTIAYSDIDQGQIRQIAVNGGLPTRIADISTDPDSLSWGSDDTILFRQQQGILRVPATGGTPQIIIPQETDFVLGGPRLLPDGDSVLFSVGPPGDWAATQIVVQSLSSGERKVLVDGGNDARYLSSGHIIYSVDDSLIAAPFDVDRLALTGDAVPVVQGVMRTSAAFTSLANYSVSENGTLAYVVGSSLEHRSLVWVNREGIEDAIGVDPSGYVYPRMSPGGTRVALEVRGGTNEIWVWDFQRETRILIDTGSDGAQYPVWNADGTRIVFSIFDDIYWKAANNTGEAELFATNVTSGTGGALSPYFFSPLGNALVFRTVVDGNNDIGMVPIGSDAEPNWLLQGPQSELNAELSPDGHWIAYQSDESGSFEIYVRPFPNVDGDFVPVSNAGGEKPLWSPDGRELFYLEPGPPVRLMAVAVETSATSFSFGSRTPVLYWTYRGTGTPSGRPYDVSRDGKRFLAIKEDRPVGSSPQIIVVQNWFEELRRLAPPAEQSE